MYRAFFRIVCAALVVAVLLGLVAFEASADVRLPHIFRNNMVLQQDMALPVWGWADPGEPIIVRFGESEVKTTATEKGEWAAKLPAQKLGNPRGLVISGKNRVAFENVLVCEVWLC